MHRDRIDVAKQTVVERAIEVVEGAAGVPPADPRDGRSAENLVRILALEQRADGGGELRVPRQVLGVDAGWVRSGALSGVWRRRPEARAVGLVPQFPHDAAALVVIYLSGVRSVRGLTDRTTASA